MTSLILTSNSAISAANLAHWEFLNYGMGYAYYTQLMWGGNLLPAFDESWVTALEGRVAPASLNFTLIGDRAFAVLKGTAPLGEKGTFIQLPVPLAPEETLVRMQFACCEAMLGSVFQRPDRMIFDQLIALKGKTPGILHEVYYDFHVARLVYALAAVDQLPSPTTNIAVAEKAVKDICSFANLFPNFRKQLNLCCGWDSS